LSDSLYYGSHGDPTAKASTDEKYRTVAVDFISTVNVAHQKHQELYVKWTKQILDAEVSFYTSALQIVQRQASSYKG